MANVGVKLRGWGVAVEIRDFQFLVTFTFPGEKVQIGIANNKIVIGTLCSRIFIYGGVHIYPEQITLRMCCLSLGGTLLPFIQGESVQGIILSQPWPMIHISIQ